jgi:hypothetical protein
LKRCTKAHLQETVGDTARERADEGRLHDRRFRAGVGQAVRRIPGWVGDSESLRRSEETPASEPDAGLAWATGQFTDQPVREVRGVGESESWRKVVERCGCNRVRDLASAWKRISRHEIAQRCPWERDRLYARHEGRRLMIFLALGSYIIPAQTIVESKVRADTKAVLSKQVTIGSALVKQRRGLLRIEVRRSEQEVGEAVSSGLVAGTKERERPVSDQVGILCIAACASARCPMRSSG